MGAALLPSAEKLVENFDRTIAGMVEVSEGKIGRIAIACPEGVAAQLIAPALRDFVAENPRVVVSLFDGDATTVEHMMHARIADFGLTGFWNQHADFEFSPVTMDRCCVLCPADHPFARRKSIRITDLDGEPILALNRDSGVRRLLEREAAANGVHLDVRFEVARVSTLVEMVASNHYLSVLTELSRPHHIRTHMKAIPILGSPFTYPVGIVVPAKRMLTAAAGAFVNTLRRHIAQQQSR